MQDKHVIIRQAQPEDVPSIATIWFKGWQDGHLGHVPDALIQARTQESFLARASARTAETTVAAIGGEVAGFVMVVDDEVEQVYVAAGHRGSGVADPLLAEAERLVAEQQYEEAWLAVVAGNLRARRFYERHGWRDTGAFDYVAKGASQPIVVPSHRYVKRVREWPAPIRPGATQSIDH